MHLGFDKIKNKEIIIKIKDFIYPAYLTNKYILSEIVEGRSPLINLNIYEDSKLNNRNNRLTDFESNLDENEYSTFYGYCELEREINKVQEYY